MSHKITFATFHDTRRLLRDVDERPPPVRIAGFRQSRRQEVPMTQTQTITPLRQRMLDDTKLRNMAASTCRSYVRSVADFSAFRCAAEPGSMVVRARIGTEIKCLSNRRDLMRDRDLALARAYRGWPGRPPMVAD